jgi:stage II sporulation protein D
MLRPVAVLLVVGAATLATPPIPAATGAPSPGVVVDGKGWGHGVGMAQDGAYAMGAAGATTDQILDAFYPGTRVGRRTGTVRVDVLPEGRPDVVVAFPGGGEVRDTPSGAESPGFPVSVAPGGSVRLSFGGGRYQATPLNGATAARPAAPPVPPAAPAEAGPGPAPSPSTTTTLLLGLLPVPPAAAPPPSSPPAAAVPATPAVPATAPGPPSSARALHAVPRGGSTVAVGGLGTYRGVVDAVAGGAGLQLVNQLDVEQYLRGMGEVRDPGWPPAALRAQAIAARTYALQAVAAGRTLCSDDQCQVYLGQTAEYAAMDRAVADTRGRVVVYGGALAETVYSANGGGVSATPEEGFGRSEPDHPYLRAAPYPSVDPQPWTVHTTLAGLAARFGYAGNPVAARVSRAGPSGRALEVVIDGDAGPLAIDGRRFAATLGLRSTLFTLHPEEAGGPAADGTPTSSRDAAGSAAPAGLASAASRRGSRPLGRPPWVALALVLIATWATAATRLRHRLGIDGRE